MSFDLKVASVPFFALVSASLVGVIDGSASAAIGVPDSESCPTQSGNCLSITAGGTGATAISGTGPNNSGIGVKGITQLGHGVDAQATDGVAVFGKASNGGTGVRGESLTGYGMYATTSGATAAVYATSPSTGVQGVSTATQSGTGVLGQVSGGSGSKGVSGTATAGNGVYGSSSGAWPSAGVYGTNTASGGIAILGNATNTTSSVGVYGQGATMGVQGYATANFSGSTIPWGVSGVASGMGSHAIDAICNGECAETAGDPTNPGLAGHFVGDVTIEGGFVGFPPYSLEIKGGGDVGKPGGGPWQATSDERVKKNVKPYKLGLAELLRVQPVSYQYNGLGGTFDGGREYVGVIAQQLEKIVPSMVSSQKAKLRPSDKDVIDLKHVDPNAFTYMLINAVQQQEAVIQRQEARIATLEQGRAPMTSSIVPGGFGMTAAFGLSAVVGLLVSRKRARGA
jgi:hypothetical protein